MKASLYDTVFEKEHPIPDNCSSTVGRLEGNGIVLRPEGSYKGTQWIQSRGVSGFHFAICNTSGGLLVGDLGSLYGTLVDVEGNGNYVRVKKDSVVPVKPGSRIIVGPKTLKYELDVRINGEDN